MRRGGRARHGPAEDLRGPGPALRRGDRHGRRAAGAPPVRRRRAGAPAVEPRRHRDLPRLPRARRRPRGPHRRGPARRPRRARRRHDARRRGPRAAPARPGASGRPPAASAAALPRRRGEPCPRARGRGPPGRRGPAGRDARRHPSRQRPRRGRHPERLHLRPGRHPAAVCRPGRAARDGCLPVAGRRTRRSWGIRRGAGRAAAHRGATERNRTPGTSRPRRCAGPGSRPWS